MTLGLLLRLAVHSKGGGQLVGSVRLWPMLQGLAKFYELAAEIGEIEAPPEIRFAGE